MSFLQVGSWNIEHLSGSHRETKKQSAFALADHIEMAGVDIIVLQEIYVTPADEEVRITNDGPVIETSAQTDRRNAELDVVCYVLEEHLGDPWFYAILPNRNEGDTSQLCAVMWNGNRVTLNKTMKIDVPHKVDGYNLWDRAPHALKFSTDMKVWRRNDDMEWHEIEVQRSLIVVPLHMKSNYGGVTKNRPVREKEAEVLCAQLDTVRAELDDDSLILIGDTNILNNAEPALECFVNNGLVDLNNNDGSTYWSKQYGDAPFDRAFVAEGRKEFKYTRQYVLRSADLVAHDRFLSDHYMIKMSVKTYLDDDDPRDGIDGDADG